MEYTGRFQQTLSRPCLGRQLEAILPEPHQCLPDTSNLSKLIEYEKHRFLKAPIWVLLQVIIITLFVTHWAGNKELAVHQRSWHHSIPFLRVEPPGARAFQRF
jgi:hypothetical protein